MHAHAIEIDSAPDVLWPPRFKAAIFDFDGTIAETAQIWHEVDRTFLGARGIQVTDDYARTLSVLGFEAGARYTIERYGLKEKPEDICAEWNRMGRALYRSRVTLRPGAEKYIRSLRQLNIPCALATTNDPEVLDAMEHVDVSALFDTRVHSRDVGAAKDEETIYLEAASRLGVEPCDCMVFEDIVVGLLSAKRAGMMTCGVMSNDPTQQVPEIRSTADFFLKSWEDIALDDMK
ncbi:MAG: HAD family hydrolase [Atopobiaceae bacterium]|jgi:HAD superfamily hydrolase (TIGR01509 family)